MLVYWYTNEQFTNIFFLPSIHVGLKLFYSVIRKISVCGRCGRVRILFYQSFYSCAHYKIWKTICATTGRFSQNFNCYNLFLLWRFSFCDNQIPDRLKISALSIRMESGPMRMQNPDESIRIWYGRTWRCGWTAWGCTAWRDWTRAHGMLSLCAVAQSVVTLPQRAQPYVLSRDTWPTCVGKIHAQFRLAQKVSLPSCHAHRCVGELTNIICCPAKASR